MAINPISTFWKFIKKFINDKRQRIVNY